MTAGKRLSRREKDQIMRDSVRGIGPRDGWTPEMLARKEHALGPNPSGGFNHDALGCEFFQVGLWDKAVTEFERAVAINPWKAIFKFHLFRAYLAMKEIDKAERMAEAIQAQAPSMSEAALAIALVREHRGEWMQARTWYRRCLSLDPDPWVKEEAEENLAALRRQASQTDSNKHAQEAS